MKQSRVEDKGRGQTSAIYERTTHLPIKRRSQTGAVSGGAVGGCEGWITHTNTHAHSQ